MKKLFSITLIFLFCMQVIFSPAVLAYSSQDKITKTYKGESSTLDAFENTYQTSDISNPSVKLSPIEKIFNTEDYKVNGKPLVQVGYNLFSMKGSSTSSTGKYDGSYILGVGEKVSVYLYGDSVDVMAMSGASLLNPSTTAEVDSSGNIFVNGVGLIPAEGKTLKQVEASINKIVGQKYNNTKAKITVASGSAFSVFVYGQVATPGKVIVGNNSSVIDALNSAGGVNKTGTLRNIEYTSSRTKKTVDLYKALFTGDDNGIILKPNDKIFVGKIGNVVAIKNGVITPGIYETKDNESLKSLIDLTGGVLPLTQLDNVVVSGIDSKTNERVSNTISWNEANSTVLKNGDKIEFRESYNTAENVVTLQGNVKYPATFTYKDGMRLSDVLKSENELLEETFISQAVIRRVTGPNNEIQIIPVFLKEFFAGTSNPILQPKDVINVYKNTNSQFVDVYGCINMPKHLTYVEGMKLYHLMTDIQFVESDINSSQNINTVDNDIKSDENEVLVSDQKDDVTLKIATANENKLIPAENVAVEITSIKGDTTVYYLYDIMINSDRIKSIDINPDDKVLFRTLRENEFIKSVKVSGFVKHPSVYKFVEGKRLVDMIDQAGGLSDEADMRGIVFKRTNIQYKLVQLAQKNNEKDIELLKGRLASGFKQSQNDQETKLEMIEQLKSQKQEFSKKYTGQIALNIKNNNLDKIKDADNIELQDGDDIYIPRMANHVSIIGEVYNEQAFVYKKGKNAGYYINSVGGFTPNANKFRLYKVGVNGKAEKICGLSEIEAGDTIVVPRKIAGNDWISPVTQSLQSIASIIVMAFAINKW